MPRSKEQWLGLLVSRGYDVSSKGRVRSYRYQGSNGRFLKEPKILSPINHPSSYPHVCIRRPNGRPWLQKVHSLVLTAFSGPRPEGMQCRHLDGNPANNNINNLCWGTPVENGQDRVRHGNESQTLTPIKIRNIRIRVARGESLADVAKRYRVSQNSVQRLCLHIIKPNRLAASA